MKLLNIVIIFTCLLIPGLAYSAEPDAPTIKELAEKKEAEDKVIKELIAEQVRQVLTKIRELIDQHEAIYEENSRVRFLEFGEYAQELEFYAYIKTQDFAEYLEHR